MTLSEAATFVGLLTGPAALLLSVMNYLRDRANLHVSIRPDMIVKNHSNYSEDKTYLIVTVTNLGRRPAYISTVCLLFPDGKNAVLSDIFFNPKDVKEGDAPRQFMCEQEELIDFNKQWSGTIALVRTSTGRQYRSKFISDRTDSSLRVAMGHKISLRLKFFLQHRWAIKRRIME